MSIAKYVVTGTVYRTPEKRFTQNNIAVSSFVLNIGENEEVLIRVISRRQALDDVIDSIEKGEKVLVEGRLQTATAKMDDGSEKRIYEIDANSIEKLQSGSVNSTVSASEDIVKFESDDFANELIGEDEIPF